LYEQSPGKKEDCGRFTRHWKEILSVFEFATPAKEETTVEEHGRTIPLTDEVDGSRSRHLGAKV
jgi:hypothetical protein